MSGTLSRSTTVDESMAAGAEVGRRMGGEGGPAPPHGHSPLQHFVQAKKKINEIFVEVAGYVGEAERFLASLPRESGVAGEEVHQAVQEFGVKVAGIREVLARDHMKVAFFGRTSNGKSTAINSLLGDKILPTGIGHTTSCFLQVEGSTTGEAYLTCEGEEEHRSLDSLPQLGSALSAAQLDSSSKVKIHWPVERCRLLGEEVVIIDSPGIDVEADLDNWIDKFCLDSDVFVLVANAESTIMLTEKKFFHKVNERLSNPNLFIVHNRWDASAGEEEQAEVRKQHTDRATAFLVSELGLCTEEEARNRIFFLSAKEALQTRLQEARGLKPSIATEDYFTRYLEYQQFEKQLESCLSSTAVRTKFAAHTARGRDIVVREGAMLGQVQEAAAARRSQEATTRKELLDRLDFTERQLEMLTAEMKDKICALVEDVEYKVARGLSEEIRRLAVLVDEFNDPFHPDPLVVNVYKSKLNHHLESGVGSNLKNRLSADLQLNMETQQKDMMDRMTALLPLEKQTPAPGRARGSPATSPLPSTRAKYYGVSRNILPRREAFEVLYHLNCDNLCSDFQEDLTFKFSLGFSCLMARFMSAGSGKRRNGHQSYNPGQSFPRQPSYQGSYSTPETPSNEFVLPQDEWGLATKLALASISSQGTMGGLLIGGLLLKTVGWRVIAVSGGLYGCVYLYERLTWTHQAKLKEFKRQYVEHAARKLRLIVDMTSANCSHQVQQELSSTFARLCHLVDESTAEMREEAKAIEREVRELEEVASRSKVLRNQATFLGNKLEMFANSYLGQD